MSVKSDNTVAFKLIGLVAVMLSLSFASVPLYDWFCRVTGYGGTPLVDDAGSDTILEETIKVRFDASKTRDMPWEFKPLEREIEIKIGETGLAFYEAYNPTDRAVAGSASFNVTPYSAGQYFIKIDCFCFEEQVLEPGQRVDMPVTYYVDPEIVNDPEAKHAHTITLSYTFSEIDLPQEDVTLAPRLDDGLSGVN